MTALPVAPSSVTQVALCRCRAASHLGGAAANAQSLLQQGFGLIPPRMQAHTARPAHVFRLRPAATTASTGDCLENCINLIQTVKSWRLVGWPSSPSCCRRSTNMPRCLPIRPQAETRAACDDPSPVSVASRRKPHSTSSWVICTRSLRACWAAWTAAAILAFANRRAPCSFAVRAL